MHQEASQEGSELLEILFIFGFDCIVGRVVVLRVIKVGTRRHLVINGKEANTHANKDRGNCKRVQKRR